MKEKSKNQFGIIQLSEGGRMTLKHKDSFPKKAFLLLQLIDLNEKSILYFANVDIRLLHNGYQKTIKKTAI